MKRYIVLTLLSIFAISISAQKAVRKAIRKGNDAFKEQRYSAAEADYAKALDENASSKQASFNLANTFYKQQRWDETLEEYKHYLTLENESHEKMSGAWSNMGNTFLKKKANEKGQPQAGMVPQGSQPQQPQQPQTDNLKASMEAYKNALRLNPQDNETRENLAIVQKMIKDQEGDGGGDDDKQDQDKKDDQKQDQKQDKKEDKQDEKKEDENQMSQDNIQQILEAIEQDEKETQERVNQAKADARKRQSDRNRRQDKDW